MLKRQSTFAAAQGDAVVVPARAGTSLAALFAGHVLQDGELILLLIKPSLWFVLLSSLKFVAVALILMISAALLDPQLPGRNSVYQEFGLFVIAGRVMWAALQWMGRLYILTDMRIVRLSGVFSVEIFDARCARSPAHGSCARCASASPASAQSRSFPLTKNFRSAIGTSSPGRRTCRNRSSRPSTAQSSPPAALSRSARHRSTYAQAARADFEGSPPADPLIERRMRSDQRACRP